MKHNHSIMFTAPDDTTDDEARQFAYIEAVRLFGIDGQFPEGTVLIDGAVRIKRRPDPAPDDWPEATIYVIANAIIDDGRER